MSVSTTLRTAAVTAAAAAVPLALLTAPAHAAVAKPVGIDVVLHHIKPQTISKAGGEKVTVTAVTKGAKACRFQWARYDDYKGWLPVLGHTGATWTDTLQYNESSYTWAFLPVGCDAKHTKGAQFSKGIYYYTSDESNLDFSLTSGWKLVRNPSAYGGSYAQGKAAPGAKGPTYSPCGAALAPVFTTGPTGGKVQVYINKLQTATVFDTHSATVKYRQLLGAVVVPAGSCPTVELRPVPAAGKTVAIDGIVIWDN